MIVAQVMTSASKDKESCVVNFDRNIWNSDWITSVKDGISICAQVTKPLPLKMDNDWKTTKVTDFVTNVGRILVVSSRVKNVLDKYVSETCEFIPVEIHNHKNKNVSSDHFLVNPLGTCDCLDHNESIFNIAEHNNEVFGVEKFAFSEEKLKSVPDVFRVKQEPREYFFKNPELFGELKALELTNVTLEIHEVK